MKRLLSVLIGVPVLIFVLFYTSPFWFKLLVAACSLLALSEFYRIVFSAGEKKKKYFGLIIGAFYSILVLFSPAQELSFMVPVTLVILITFCFLIREANRGEAALEGIASQAGLYLLGTFYVAGFTLYVALLRERPQGIFWIMMLLMGTWLNDTTAYLVGHAIGHHKLAVRVSPGKTIEGFVGGFFGTAVALFVVRGFFHNPISIKATIFLTLVIGFLGPVGDLAESLIKRSYQVKDSGNLIPGHGGVFDRIDALLFNAPFVYYCALFLK
ncbi:MAG: phosphatidate cytidylyltransferase [Deltaproteobacteria bacterium]|nr:phosphatidate cytidylyltransferase [Deltaproteobacteria bacterium]